VAGAPSAFNGVSSPVTIRRSGCHQALKLLLAVEWSRKRSAGRCVAGRDQGREAAVPRIDLVQYQRTPLLRDMTELVGGMEPETSRVLCTLLSSALLDTRAGKHPCHDAPTTSIWRPATTRTSKMSPTAHNVSETPGFGPKGYNTGIGWWRLGSMYASVRSPSPSPLRVRASAPPSRPVPPAAR